MIVAIENARCAVASYIDVRPAIIVEIERDYSERVVTIGLIYVRLGRDVLKLSVPPIVIKNVLRSRQAARPAHHRGAFPNAGRPLSRRRRGRDVKIHVIGNEQVQEAVAIVVHEGAARSPGLS